MIKLNVSFFASDKMLLTNPYALFGKIALILGLFFAILGVVLFAFIGSDAGTLRAILINGALWLIIGLVIILFNCVEVSKMKHLKQKGVSYDVEIINLMPSASVRIGNIPVIYIEGIYINGQGHRCKVRSRLFLWRNYSKDGLYAKVYVDMQNPRRQTLEITEITKNNHRIDIDYT